MFDIFFEFFLVAWFLSGILGYWIAEIVSEHQHEKRPPANMIFLIIAGPILLVLAIIGSVLIAMGRKPYSED